MQFVAVHLIVRLTQCQGSAVGFSKRLYAHENSLAGGVPAIAEIRTAGIAFSVVRALLGLLATEDSQFRRSITRGRHASGHHLAASLLSRRFDGLLD